METYLIQHVSDYESNGELLQSCVIKDKNQLLEYCESRSTHNEWKFLNLMEFDDALAIWRNS